MDINLLMRLSLTRVRSTVGRSEIAVLERDHRIVGGETDPRNGAIV